jgi:hypothetical protein
MIAYWGPEFDGSEGFTAIPRDFDLRCSLLGLAFSEASLFRVLIGCPVEAALGGNCRRASFSYIVARTGWNERYVRKLLTALAAKGMVVRSQDQHERGGFIYDLSPGLARYWAVEIPSGKPIAPPATQPTAPAAASPFTDVEVQAFIDAWPHREGQIKSRAGYLRTVQSALAAMAINYSAEEIRAHVADITADWVEWLGKLRAKGTYNPTFHKTLAKKLEVDPYDFRADRDGRKLLYRSKNAPAPATVAVVPEPAATPLVVLAESSKPVPNWKVPKANDAAEWADRPVSIKLDPEPDEEDRDWNSFFKLPNGRKPVLPKADPEHEGSI